MRFVVLILSLIMNVTLSYIMGEYITCWENNRFSYRGYHDPEYVNDTTYREDAGGEGDVCDHTDPNTNEVRDTCYFQVYLGQETWTYKCMHRNECPLKDPITGEGIMGCYTVPNKRITCCCQEDFCNGEEYLDYALLGYPDHFIPQTTVDRSNKPQNGTAPTPKPTEPEIIMEITDTEMPFTTDLPFIPYVDPYENKEKPRIINGIPTTSNEYPWIVSLRQEIIIDTDFDELYTISHPFCGGLMIELSPPIILTSAHCFNDFIYNETDDILRVDINDTLYDTYLFADINRTYPDSFNDTFETLPILSYLDTVHIHDDYDPTEIPSGHDVALLIFNDFNDTQLDLEVDTFPILSSECCSMNETNESISEWIAIGYGYIGINATGSNIFQTTQLQYIDTEICINNSLEKLFQIRDVDNIVSPEQIEMIKESIFSPYYEEDLICVHGNNTDACYGDSSGPLLRMTDDDLYEIIGIFSFNMEQCNDEYPAIYTNIANEYEWIRKTIDFVVEGITWSPTKAPTVINETLSPTTATPTEFFTTQEEIEESPTGPLPNYVVIAVVVALGLCIIAVAITTYITCGVCKNGKKSKRAPDGKGKYKRSHIDDIETAEFQLGNPPNRDNDNAVTLYHMKSTKL